MEKRAFDIFTDSACDMPEEFFKENGISCVNLGYTLGDENYEGETGNKLAPQEFYERLAAGGMPTTTQVTGEMAQEYMRKSLENGRDILVIAFSSALSGTAGSFTVAARELSKEFPERKIRVVDSLNASMGEGLLLYYAMKKADEGASLDETADYAEDLKLRICAHFTVDDLFHLKRGGRVSAATAAIGTMLKIKPVMHVSDEGKLVAIGKAMGRKKSLHTVVENLFRSADMDETDPIFITHGNCEEDIEYVKKLIWEKMPNVKIYVNFVGAVIGSHSGCGTVALFNKGKSRNE